MDTLSVEQKARILIVQDDPVMLGLVCGSLRPDGHLIIEMDSPSDALRIGAAEFQNIDLVVTSINTRPISGIELAKRLARKGVDAPMLFISPTHSLAVVIANSLGHSAVIELPFSGAELRTAVRKCLAVRRRKYVKD
jgi:DNA-binding NtrC family response regulator